MNRKIFLSVLAALTGLTIYSSCTKVDTTDLGNELIPAVDNVKTFETVLDVQTDNFLYPDSTRVDGSSLHALGIISDDPEFGSTDARIYSNFSPATYGTSPFAVKDSVVIDSIVLSLSFGGFYGDSNAIQRYEVYQIDPATNNFKDSLYRVDEPDFAVLPGVLGSRDVDFKILNDSVLYRNGKDTVRTINELRIKLDTAFGRQFVNFDTAVQYKNDSAFKTYFKGLAIKTNSGASANKTGLAYFSLTNTTNTKLTFYTRVTNNGVIDTTTQAFAYNSGTQANLITRQAAHGYKQYLENGNPVDDKVYIQSSPGSYATVKVLGLDTFAQVNRVIHRAELIIEQIPSQLDNIYTTPPLMFIDAKTATGDSTLTIRNDYIPNSQTGSYDIATLGGNYLNKKYVFTLSRYLQSVVTKKQPYYLLRIYAPLYTDPYYQDANAVSKAWPTFVYVNSPVANGRLVAGGGSHPTQKMRVRIIYSKI
ncbi:DUF4270 family protein [Paraflavitalea sp. CAU 1676]|uniref:DUF4270 family protein n=1 Tax=Paraflavitalea sp. CAU 1676 TaxID=3032598 RepID=UPI0023DA6161|nr:DUF4270 family protein [Paraflavitalea sp. CAU 1676]MDF2187774.1 DUF4270 family protein [Paraflavitalea sp. CAU 1676]